MESQSLIGRRNFNKTRRAYEEWLKQEPDNAVASFMLRALKGDAMPRAPNSVVTGLFDRQAATFEEHLAKLDYRVPYLVHQVLEREIENPSQSLSVLDGGCGTGLCGSILRPYARRLKGVDLSAGMLAKARSKNLYDELIETELTEYLNACAEQFDLIVFADTLCYFGDLEPVLQSVKRILKPRGILVFSVENADEGETQVGYRLHPHGRYSHTRPYVESLFVNSSFSSVAYDRKKIRL